MKHRPELDGLRGIAILIVLGAHTGVPGFADGGGGAGVTLFFVLSGFVVGYAYDERRAKGAPAKIALSFWEFVKRRLIRLHPVVPIAATAGPCRVATSASYQYWPEARGPSVMVSPPPGCTPRSTRTP